MPQTEIKLFCVKFEFEMNSNSFVLNNVVEHKFPFSLSTTPLHNLHQYINIKMKVYLARLYCLISYDYTTSHPPAAIVKIIIIIIILIPTVATLIRETEINVANPIYLSNEKKIHLI